MLNGAVGGNQICGFQLLSRCAAKEHTLDVGQSQLGLGRAEPTHPRCICSQSQVKVEQGSSKPSESLADSRLLTIPTSWASWPGCFNSVTL